MYLKNIYAVKAWKEDTEVQDGNCLHFRILLLNHWSVLFSVHPSVCELVWVCCWDGRCALHFLS